MGPIFAFISLIPRGLLLAALLGVTWAYGLSEWDNHSLKQVVAESREMLNAMALAISETNAKAQEQANQLTQRVTEARNGAIQREEVLSKQVVGLNTTLARITALSNRPVRVRVNQDGVRESTCGVPSNAETESGPPYQELFIACAGRYAQLGEDAERLRIYTIELMEAWPGLKSTDRLSYDPATH